MKFFKRFNSIYYKLIFTYTILTIMLTVSIGSIMLVYLNKNYKQEITKFQLNLLQHAENEITDSVLNRIEMIYVDISTEKRKNQDILYFTNNTTTNNNVKLYNAYMYLKEVEQQNSDIIESIHIYYKQNKEFISSSFGNKQFQHMYPDIVQRMEWIRDIQELPPEGIWVNNKVEGQLEDSLLRVRRFPLNNNENAIIIFSVRKEAISSIMSNIVAHTCTSVYLYDNNNQVICTYNENAGVEDIVANQLTVDVAGQQISGVVTKINGKYHILNYLVSNKMGWKLASVMPVNQYYKNVNMMMVRLGVSCLIILLIGLMVSLCFTKITYNPLTNLINQIITKLESKQLKKGDNECELINSAVTNMSMKIEGLQQILSKNMPMIKNNVIKAILKGRTYKKEEIVESLKMINIEMEYPYFITAIIDLEQAAFKKLSIEDRQYTRINIMNNIERIKMADLNCYTTEISDYWIGVIINFHHIESQRIKELFKQMDQLPVNTVSVIFSQVYEDIVNSRSAFSECKIGAKYKKILMDNDIINYEDIVVREKNQSKISREFINELDIALKVRAINKITEIVNQFVLLIQKEPYSYKECQFNILSMVSLLSTYSKEMGYNAKLSQKRLFIEEFQEIQYIIEFERWFKNTAQCIFDFVEQRNQHQASDTINLVKKYICEHISDELSLDRVAQEVKLNPKYLSKLFIMKNNTSFIDYVTSVRMEKARKMLVESTMSINKISAEIGYLTSSYFIKKFKETYGYTPAKYRKYHKENS